MKNNFYQINLRSVALTGLFLMVVGYVFALIETFYFDSAWLPESRAEFIYDFISSTVCGGGGSLFLFAIIIKTKASIKLLKSELLKK